MHINSYLICMYACIYVCILFDLFLFFSVNIFYYNNPELDNKHYRHAH